MKQNIAPGDALRNVNLAFEAVDASVRSVWQSHDSTHAASDLLSNKQLLVSDCNTTASFIGLATYVGVHANRFISVHIVVECFILGEHGFVKDIVLNLHT